MKAKTDIFGYEKPVQIETDEWWFGGRIIQKQNHPELSKFASWDCDDAQGNTNQHSTLKDAVDHALKFPCVNPNAFPENYIGPFDDEILKQKKIETINKISSLFEKETKLEIKRKKMQKEFAFRYAPLRPGDKVQVFWIDHIPTEGKTKKTHHFYGIIDEVRWEIESGFIYVVKPKKKDFTDSLRHKYYHFIKETQKHIAIEKIK